MLRHTKILATPAIIVDFGEANPHNSRYVTAAHCTTAFTRDLTDAVVYHKISDMQQ